MSKKLKVGLLVGVLVLAIFASAAVVGAQSADETLDSIYREMHQLRRRVIERRVELGELTAEQGEQALERIEQRFQERQAEGFACAGGGREGWPGRMGRGQGTGAGRGLRDGSCGNCPQQP